MALRGNLRDFPVAEILQLLGSQKKTGCLIVDSAGTTLIFVQDGRIVSCRPSGMSKDDPLIGFLRLTHRLSREQLLGIESIHRESQRDLEDLLVNGRYLDAAELARFLERQILEDVMRLTHATEGSYQFDPDRRWTLAPHVRLSIEGVLMEVARRADELKRYAAAFPDRAALLSVRDFPDPDAPLSEEERELFGIIDGRHTIAEVLAAAPLSEYEGLEVLFHMLESRWIELGESRRGAPAAVPTAPAPRPARRSWVRELVFAAAVVVALAGLRAASRLFVPPAAAHGRAQDVYVATQVRDLRFALELYRREQGRYPGHLERLAEDHFVEPGLLHVPGYLLRYQARRDGSDYTLTLDPQR